MIHHVPIRVFFILLFLISMAESESTEVKQALLQFMQKLSPGSDKNVILGWNMSSDPCIDKWKGLECEKQNVKRIVLDRFNLTGSLDVRSLCTIKSITVLSMNDNYLFGGLPQEISACRRLTHLYLHGNNLTGVLPSSLSNLNNLKRIDVSNNKFSGEIPGLSRISGLLSFLAQNNQLSGKIPTFDFSNLEQFNVSNNNLRGKVPDLGGYFNASSVLGNPGLCGNPLPNACPTAEKKSPSSKQFLIYSGYGLIGILVLFLITLKLVKRNCVKQEKSVLEKSLQADKTDDEKTSGASSNSRAGGNRSEYSITSVESGMVTSSLLVLSSPVVKSGLKFEDLLRAPAELIGRGRHGSLYKVILNSGVTLAVKRIRDWEIMQEDFQKRMQRIDQMKHPNVIPVVAYYSSRQEKLLVFEFQRNGNLFARLHGSNKSKIFDWGRRLNTASEVAEALAFMHTGLYTDGVPHGNLKSSNILFNDQMAACITEYGVTTWESPKQDQSYPLPQSDHQSSQHDSPPSLPQNYGFTRDVYSFGVILLELLTGKIVQDNGFDLATWVNTAIREEWTVEVFDKALVSEGASEERMLKLLKIALKCINPLPGARPNMSQVAEMINFIKEDEEKSISSDI